MYVRGYLQGSENGRVVTIGRNVKRLNGKQLTVSSLNLFSDKIASTEEPISKESLPERIDDSEHASSVSTVTSKDSAPPYSDMKTPQNAPFCI